jgi:hypothetical protein
MDMSHGEATLFQTIPLPSSTRCEVGEP